MKARRRVLALSYSILRTFDGHAAAAVEAAAANPTTPERFNENAVGLSGVVQRVIARDGNIALRLLSRTQTEAYVNVTLLGETVGGKHVSVGKGNRIAVTGYLIDAPMRKHSPYCSPKPINRIASSTAITSATWSASPRTSSRRRWLICR